VMSPLQARAQFPLAKLPEAGKSAPMTDYDKAQHESLFTAYKNAATANKSNPTDENAKAVSDTAIALREFDEQKNPQGLAQSPAAAFAQSWPAAPAGGTGFMGTPGRQNQFAGTPQNFIGTPGGANQFVNPAATYQAAGGTAKPTGTIPQSAIDYLAKNPDTADQFDAMFGKGTSQQYLAQSQADTQ